MERLDCYDHLGFSLRENVTVELKDRDFLCICVVLQPPRSKAVLLQGHRFRRTRSIYGIVGREKDEVCWIQALLERDRRPADVQSIETVSVTQVIARRELCFTHQASAASSADTDAEDMIVPAVHDLSEGKSMELVEQHLRLTCRSKLVLWFADAKARERAVCSERAVIFLGRDECGPDIVQYYGSFTVDPQPRQGKLPTYLQLH